MDPGADTVSSFNVVWDDGSVDTNVPYLNLSTQQFSHLYLDDNGGAGPHEIRIDLVNEDGLHFNAGSTTVEVLNVAPSGSLLNGGAVNAGTPGVVFLAGVFDPANTSVGGTRDPLVFDYDFNNNGIIEPGLGEILGTTAQAAVVPGSFLTSGPSQTIRAVLRDGDGGNTELFTTIPVLEPVSAPETTSIKAGSTAWDPLFRQFVDPSDSLGIDVEAAANSPLAQVNVNELYVQFSEDVNVTSGDLLLTGVTVADYSGLISGFNYESETFLATWTLSTPLEADRLNLQFEAVTDIDGNPLVATSVDFTALPADSNGDEIVLSDDLTQVRNLQFELITGLGTATADYSPRHDLNGDGLILSDDLILSRNSQFTLLPPLAAAASRTPQAPLAAGFEVNNTQPTITLDVSPSAPLSRTAPLHVGMRTEATEALHLAIVDGAMQKLPLRSHGLYAYDHFGVEGQGQTNQEHDQPQELVDEAFAEDWK